MIFLVLAGYAFMFIGGIMILIAAFKESVLWGLGTLIVPLVGLIFVITHWEESKNGFLLNIGGLVLAVVGAVLGGGH